MLFKHSIFASRPISAVHAEPGPGLARDPRQGEAGEQ
jgi:hypothetical protein